MASGVIVILGTGGTIAGAAASATDNLGYTAGQLGVRALVAAVPALASRPIETRQLAQLDSKDMSHVVWCALARQIAAETARPEVAGVVVTHGTDTLEETAYLLHRVSNAAKPVVLTAAMRPATSLQADGPQNLLDAVTLAADPDARGVLVALAGRVWAGHEVRKRHSYAIDAFDAGDAGPLALLREGRIEWLRDWPAGGDIDPAGLPVDDGPWVEIVTSHAGARGAAVDALVAAGVHGLVVAGTGNGSVHAELDAGLRRAAAAGVRVLRTTRCAAGGLVGDGAGNWAGAGGLTPSQARVALWLELLGACGR